MLVIIGVAHLDGDGGKNGAGINPLQAFYLDVFDDKWRYCPSCVCCKKQAGYGCQRFQTEERMVSFHETFSR